MISRNFLKWVYKLSNFALKSELQKTGLAQKSLNQDVYEILESIALKGATYSDDGSIAYKNEDGSTKYYNGKPLTLADKVAELEQSEAYKPLFKAVGVGGTGANPNPNGNGAGAAGKLDGSKAEQEAYIKAKYNL